MTTSPGTAIEHDATVIGSKFELFVTDDAASTRFYTTLGFTIVQRNADGYTTLRSGPVIIAL